MYQPIVFGRPGCREVIYLMDFNYACVHAILAQEPKWLEGLDKSFLIYVVLGGNPSTNEALGGNPSSQLRARRA